MTQPRPAFGPQDGYRAIRLAGISETRPSELDTVYGTGGGIGDQLSAFRYTGAGDEDVSLRGSAVEGQRTGTMEPRPDHIVFWIGDGTATITDPAGRTTQVRPGRPMLLAASERYRFTAAISRVSMLHLSDRMLRSVLADDGVQVAGPLRFQPVEADEELAPLRTVLQALGSRVTDARVTGAERTTVNRKVARAVVDTFPVVNPSSSSSDRLRDALAFVQSNAHLPITLVDIATAARMSPRGVQQSFARSVGVSPLGHLRNVRLDAVHGALLRADPATASVAEVARTWGFAHLGRFSGAYRERFGELPSATLRGRARPAD